MPVTCVDVRELPISSLTRFPGNARRGDVDAIRASVRRLGQYRTIVVRDTGGGLVILAGNHTMLALEAEGHATVRAEVIRCSDEEARRINLADNRLAELGGYDDGDLAALLAGLDGDFDGTGWTQDDYDALTEPEPAGNGDPDDAPEPPEEPVTRPGDLYQLGPHRLLCGDCTNADDVDRLLDGAGIAYTFTSPPYGIDLEYEDGEPLAALIKLISGAIGQIDRISAPAAYATMNYADVFRPGDKGFTLMSPHYDGPFRACGWHLRGNRVWFKPFGRLALSYATSTTMNLREWEYIQTWRRGTSAEKLRAHGITVRGVWQSFGDAIIPDWRSLDVTTSKQTHPAAFPVLLPVAGIRAYSDPGDAVFEPFGGSGTTMMGAHIEQRVAYVMELDPRYCDVICQRFEDYTGIKPELVS